MSLRLKRDRAELEKRLKSGQSKFAKDGDMVYLLEMRPNNFPALVIRMWKEDEFLGKKETRLPHQRRE